MKKVLVTGISGFAGGFLSEHLLSQSSYEVVGTYHSSQPGHFSGMPITLRKVNLTESGDVQKLMREVMPDVIVHLAAMTSPGESFDDPAGTLINNAVSQISLLEAVRKEKLEHARIIIVSSADVYGHVKPEDIPIDEEAAFRPGNPYGVSKVTQDFIGLQYFISYKLNIVRVRPFNHFGPRQSDRFAVASFAKQIAEIEKNKREPVMKVGNLESERDFTDVRDVVRAYEMLFEKGKAGEAYNLGSGNAYKIADLLTKLISLAHVPVRVEKDPELYRPSDTPLLICNNKKLIEATGWMPEISIDESLKSILDYWRGVV